MRFSELVKLLERNGFACLRRRVQFAITRSPGMTDLSELIIMVQKRFRPNMSCGFESGRDWRKAFMIDLKYSLVIEATEDPNFFGFYSPELEGFTGIGHS